jgi:8-oxo-dGTP pyrophosphatase MutT (NUDIX family)
LNIQLYVRRHVQISEQQIRDSALFRDWLSRLDPGWSGTVTVNEVDVRDHQLWLAQLTVQADDRRYPSKLVLRSETVDVLTVLTDGKRSYVIFLYQERLAAGGGLVVSNPAGGKGWHETPEEAGMRELLEELGLRPADVDKFRIELSRIYPRPVLVTSGLTNERAFMFKAVLHTTPAELPVVVEQLSAKRTGVFHEEEELTLVVVRYGEAAWFIDNPKPPVKEVDAKVLLSLRLAGL